MAQTASQRLWAASDGLSERVKRLRNEYFSHGGGPGEGASRAFHNEVLPFGTGTPWDVVFSRARWTNVPELMPFLNAYEDSLAAAARIVPLPEGFWREPLIKRAALFFGEVLRKHLPVVILDGELIVGGHFNAALSLCLTRKEERRRARLAARFLREVTHLSALGVGNCGAIPGHLIPDYPKVLRVGFRGIVKEIETALADEEGTDCRATLEAFAITCRAARDLAARYANEAERLAVEAGPARATELREIARICRKVPWEPAETFHEALQSLWITHMLVLTAESYPGAGVSFGRFDQYLYRYLRADIEAGRTTVEGARELLRCFWIKPNYAYDFQGRVGRNQGITSSFGQLVTLAGCGPDGEDLSNDLTYLCLDVIEEMNLLEPKPNIRLHQRSPERLVRRICEMLSKAQGSPFLINFDEHSMAGLRRQGLPEGELW
ncbi:MAG TPA: pyruvate formate lyase family protein, partial [Candidatus Hydrogenedentes bacterium]|nr:pyruvate formate lyase family protein [Candidatus Hydrogenedentota bacterium]